MMVLDQVELILNSKLRGGINAAIVCGLINRKKKC